MVSVIGFLELYSSYALRILCFIGWLIIAKRYSKSVLDRQVSIYFMLYVGIYIIWSTLMIFTDYSYVVYLVFWVLISVFKFYFFVTTLSEIFKWEKFLTLLSTFFLLIPTIVASILSYFQESYYSLNTMDFYNKIFFLFVSIIILHKILKNVFFIHNLKSFFIFSGFVLYFSLHIVGRVLLMYGQDWQFNKTANLISLFFWLGSTFFIWNINKSKHLF